MNQQSSTTQIDYSVESILATINLEDFGFIGNFGRSLHSESANSALEISSGIPSILLADKLQYIVARLREVNPAAIQSNPNYWQKLTGTHLAKTVKFEVINQTVGQLIANASETANEVIRLANAMQLGLQEHERDVQYLRAHIEAAEYYLRTNPHFSRRSGLEIESVGERFLRRIQNLKALLTSKEMDSVQIKMTINEAIDIVDRYCQVRDIMVPMWLDHVNKLRHSMSNDPALLAAATKAHTELVNGLINILKSKNYTIGA